MARISASEKDYFSVAYKIPFKVEYHDSEITPMGLASYWHKLLVTNIIILLNKIFNENLEIIILGSNSFVQIPKFEGGYYMPDVLILNNEPIFN